VSPVECSDADSEADDSLGLETSPPAGRGSHASFHPFAEPVALLCWRIAERLSPTVPDEAKRRRTLLESCVSLLNTETGTGARQQLPMVAAAQEGLADGWLLEAHQLMPLPPVGAPPVAGANRTPIRGFDPARRLQVAGSGLPSPCPPCDEALAAVAAQRNAARALLGGVRALREVCRPGAAPPRLLRMLAKLARTETALARRYTLVGRPGRAVAALRRAAAAQAALRTPVGSLSSLPGIAKPPAAAGGAVRAAERGHMLLTLADACALVARAAAGPDAAAARAEVAMHAEELRVALQEPELTLPSWAGGGAGVANAGVGGAGMTGEVVVGVGSGSGFPSGGSAQEASQPFPTGSGSPSASPPPALHRSPSGGWPAAASPLAPEPSLAYPNSEPPAVPTISAFAPDAEGNWKLAIGFYLSAVRTIPSASLAAAHARLRDAYTSLGQLYVSADRFTKACRHYQQGIELFRSTADPRSAAVMAVAFARALRSRLGAAPPVGSAGIPPAALLPAAAARLAMAAGGGTPPPAEMAQAELHDFERCAALLEQAKALLGGEGEGVPPRVGTPPAGADGALWAEAELELGATQLMQAARLDESLPYAPHRAEAIAAVTALLVSAAARLEAGGEPALAGDARYRLGLLMRGEAERAAAGRGANPASGAAVALASLVCAKDHFEAAQRLLPPAARPAEHVLVRCDTAAVHRALALPPCTAPNAPTPARHAELHAALAQLLATHDVFGLYAFPLPPPSPTAKAHGGPAAPSEPAAPDLAADGTAKVPPDTASPAPAAKLANGAAPQREAEAGDPPPRPVLPPVSVSGGACALVAATWPVVEAEVQAVLKELVKLHAGAGATASASKYKRLYRLSLTQRELLGTSILLQIAEEVGAQPAE
jgi:tetratricopeptide (TPR) repeat protein